MKTLAVVEAAAQSQEPVDLGKPDGWKPEPSDLMDVLSWIGEAERAIADIDAQAAHVKTLIDNRAETLKRSHEHRAAYLRSLVAECATLHKEELLTGKKKSIDLLTGRIAWRRKPARLEVVNPEELEAWLPDQDPSLYRMKIQPDKKALAALVEATGVIPPGCEWIPAEDSLSIDAEPLPSITAPKQEELP